MRRFFFCFCAAVALAGSIKAHASEGSENIASQSELVGTFIDKEDSGDGIYNNVYSDFTDFLHSLDGCGFDYTWDNVPLDVDGSSTVSGNSFYFFDNPYPDTFVDDFVEAYNSYDTYYGAISSQYLEYMRGYLPKLRYDYHYVASRVSQYDYIFAYGEDLSFSSGVFSGSDVTVIRWNTSSSGTFSHAVESSFTLRSANYLVYSDLTDFYPSLDTSSGLNTKLILFLFCCFFVFFILKYMYGIRKFRR